MLLLLGIFYRQVLDFRAPVWCDEPCRATMDRLNIIVPKALFLRFSDTEALQSRAQELLEAPLEKDRDIAKMKRMPKVSMEDVTENKVYVEVLISLDEDEHLQGSLTMEKVFYLLDKHYEWGLSGQKEVTLRATWHRFEGDKGRLIYAKFLRELERSKFSNDFFCWRLKQQFMAREAKKARITPALLDLEDTPQKVPTPASASDVSAVSAGDLVALGASDVPPVPEALLDRMLPALPLLHFDEDEHAVSDDSPLQNSPEQKAIETVSVPSSPVQAHEDGAGELQAAPQAAPLVAQLDAEGYPMRSPEFDAEFEAPLPPGLEAGMPAAKKPRLVFQQSRPAAPANLTDYIAGLASEAPVDHKAFLGKIQSKNRPAAAMKRPASAGAPKPAAPEAAAPEAALAAPNVPVPHEIDVPTLANMYTKCVTSLDGLIDDGSQKGKVQYSYQRKTHAFQVMDVKTKRVIVQTTDKQYSTRDRAKQAISVLRYVYGRGATKEHLQQCKAMGWIHEVKCGKLSLGGQGV